MVNVDGSKRIWKQPEIKDIFEKCGAKKPDKATWGDVQYVFAMYYSDGFPKVFKCENELVKAFGRARRGKDISSFERQEKESGFNFLYNLNGRMQSGHIIIDGIGLFKQIMKSGT